MICPHCNSYVSVEWEFCRSCGKQLDRHLKKKKCPKCGIMNYEYATKCEGCNAMIGPKHAESSERKSAWDSWLGLIMATALILLTLLIMYLLLTH